MKLHTGVLAITWAIVAAMVYVIGGILHVVSPWGAPALVSYIFHIDVIELAIPFTWDGFLVGVAVFAVVGAMLGAVTGWLYNTIASRGKVFGFASSALGASKT